MVRWLVGLGLSLALLWALPTEAAQAGEPDGEQRVVDLVNQIRVGAGLPALSVSAELTTSARRYAGYMAAAGFFGHQGPDGSTVVTRARAAGYVGWTYLGENLAAGQPDPQSVVRAWMDSPSHRANLLSPLAREIGIGHVYQPGSRYGHYWAGEFGARPADAVTAAPATLAGASRAGAAAAPINVEERLPRYEVIGAPVLRI